jgi:ribosomal protein S18 acetylase RimI-like enzyme
MEVRLARGDEVPQLAAMLARAFHDDPVTAWFMRNERRRSKYAERFFGWQLHRLLGQEHVYVAAGHTPPNAVGPSAAAVWALPGRWRESNWEALRLFVALVPALASHLPAATRGVERVEKRHPAQPHLYLAVLGTDPPAQGRGIGSAVLRPGLDVCDREGLPAYLESSKESNVGFYSRFGFRVTDEVQMPGGGPTVWLMWRDPS